MMDRGCFNGPGGPHRRWVVPPVGGAAASAKVILKAVSESDPSKTAVATAVISLEHRNRTDGRPRARRRFRISRF